MAEAKKGPAAIIRPIVLLLVFGTIGYFVWKSATKREDYTGGDVHTTGTIDAVHVQLGFQVAGRIAEMPVVEGSRVQAGQLVARLATEDLAVRAHTAEAMTAAARAALAQARANREKAVRDLERTKVLLASGATTPQQMDAMTAAADIATAQVQAADAQIRQSESALADARLQMAHAELRAPAAGEVSEKVHQVGEMVTIGTPVVTIAEVDTVKVLAAVDETRIGAVRPGDAVALKVYTFDKRTFPGTVTDIRPAGDFATRKDWGAQRRDIRTFTVTARVPNPEHLLKDGMTADVVIHVTPSARTPAESDR
jgi:RND family efflux transporter MFP subunit